MKRNTISLLGNEEAAGLLEEILEEEKAANEGLTELARATCNQQALGENDRNGSQKPAAKNQRNHPGESALIPGARAHHPWRKNNNGPATAAKRLQGDEDQTTKIKPESHFMKTPTPRKAETGKVGWALLWVLGVPLPILILVYLMKGCT